MPSRRRPKSSSPAVSAAAAPPSSAAQSDLQRFAAAVKESEAADRAAKERVQQERVDAERLAREATARVDALAAARRELKRAIEAVRQAQQGGRGRAEADQAWKLAKARVIELETGTPPTWAPVPPVELEVAEVAEVAEVEPTPG